MAIDGVLRKLIGGSIIPEGYRLYQSLASTGAIILLLNDERDREATENWLELNGLNSHVLDFAHGATHVYLANRLRRRNYDIDMIVEPDPFLAQELIKAGFNVLLFTHAQYAHPSWRPDTDKGTRPWADIVSETTQQAKLKARDDRLRTEE